MKVHNLIIIGSGPAGYTAALYASRANLNPFLIGGFIMGGQSGGQLMTTTEVENFPGFPDGITGPELMVNMRKQAERFGTQVLDKDVVKVDFSQKPFRIWTDEEEYAANAVIISTGAAARRMKTDFEERFWNKGISACATCDGALPLFRNKPIVVVGGGDSAMEEALYLTRFGSEVHIVNRRDEFRASPIMADRAKKHPKISFKTPYVWVDSAGDKLLEKVILENVKTKEKLELPANGLFLAIGHVPNTAVFKGQIDLDKVGYVKTDGNTRTNVSGIFASGDCVDFTYRQAVTAAGMGCQAALQSMWYLENENHSN